MKRQILAYTATVAILAVIFLGGIGAVINNQIASSTYYYLARVKNNLRLLKG